MGSDVRGHTVPAGSDGFNPQGDMVTLGLTVNDLVPVANVTARNTALTNIGATTSDPLVVIRADTQMVEASWGSGFYALTDHPLAVVKSGSPAGRALAMSGTVDMISSGDTGGIPTFTPDPGGRVRLDLAFQYVATTAGTAAAANLQLLIDGSVAGQPAWLVHTGLSTDANVLKQYTVPLEGWLTPGTSHTINARLTWLGGGGITLEQIQYAVRF